MVKSGYLSRGFRVAVIFVSGTETKAQAWRRHVKELPEDKNADIKIFNFAFSESPKNCNQFHDQHWWQRQEDKT